MLGLHLVEHGQRVRAVPEPLAQDGPDQVILGSVMHVQLALEQIPARRYGPLPVWAVPVWALCRLDQTHQVAPERVVCGDHDRQIGLATAVPGGRAYCQLLCGHLLSPRPWSLTIGTKG